MIVYRSFLRIGLKASSLNLTEICVILSNLKFLIVRWIFYLEHKPNSLIFEHFRIPDFDVVADWIARRQTWTRSQHSCRSKVWKVRCELMGASDVFIRDATNSSFWSTNNRKWNAVASFSVIFWEALDLAVMFCVDFEELQISFRLRSNRIDRMVQFSSSFCQILKCSAWSRFRDAFHRRNRKRWVHHGRIGRLLGLPTFQCGLRLRNQKSPLVV